MTFTKYPSGIDDSSSLPITSDNVTPVKADVVNALREAIIAVESDLGILPNGTYGTVRARLDAMEAAIAAESGGGGGGGGGGNRVSAYGSVHLTNLGASLNNGFNIATITRNSIGTVTFTFITPISTSYSIVASSDNDGGTVTTVIKTINGFTLERGDGAGALVDQDFSFSLLSETIVPTPVSTITSPVVGWGTIHLTSLGATIQSSLNIASAVRTGVGQVALTFSSSVITGYSVVPSTNIDGGQATTTTQNVAGFVIERADSSGVASDADFSFVVLSQGVQIPAPPVTPLSPIRAWGNITLTSGGAILSSGSNILTVSRTAVGAVTVTYNSTIGTPYAVLSSILIDDGELTITSQSSTQFTCERANSAGVASDSNFSFAIITDGQAPSPPPIYSGPSCFGWGRVELTNTGAVLTSNFNVSSATRTALGTVLIQLTNIPAFGPLAITATSFGIAGSVVESSQSYSLGQIVFERGDLFGAAIDAGFSFTVYTNG